jgi:hypothetical protein
MQAIVESEVFWKIAPFSQVEFHPSYGEIYCLHLQGRRESQTSIQQEAIGGYVLDSLFNPENGGNMVLRNIGELLPDCTVHVHVYDNGMWSRDRVVGIATGYGLDDREVGVRVVMVQEFFLLCIVQTGSEVHTTSYTMGTGSAFPGVKRPGPEADHSLPTNAEVNKM